MSDWYESESPFPELLIAELRRLKRRAQARWPLVVLIGVALTAAVVWKVARKPTLYRARVVLAITEGEFVSGRDATPLGELRDYVGNVLLSNAELAKFLDEKQLFVAARKRFGDELVLADLRDAFHIAVWRNYFQYSYSYDERRTARLAVAFTDADPAFAYEMARSLTNLVIAREGQHRVEAAAELAEQSNDVLVGARARFAAARLEHQAEEAALAAAERIGTPGPIAVHRMRAAELAVAVVRAEESFYAIEQNSTVEALQAAVTAAGLALELTIVDDRRPERAERSLVLLIGVGLVALCMFLPLAGIVIGAFDVRVHDLDDVGRLELATLGHLPGFRGDQVGALRDRGVGDRRMPSWWPWR